MTSESDYRPSPWQRGVWVQVLAILLGLAPVYGMSIMMQLSTDEPPALRDIFLYTTALAGVMIVVMFLLLRYLCGERISDLNLKPGQPCEGGQAAVFLLARMRAVDT